MKRTKHSIILFLLILLAIASFTACGKTDTNIAQDIVILYTNDVHCAIDENIGYAGLAAYKKSQEAKTPYVTLVDCGDAYRAISGADIAFVNGGGIWRLRTGVGAEIHHRHFCTIFGEAR